MFDEIARRLAEVDGSNAPAVVRFDEDQASGAFVILPSAFNPPTSAHLALLTLAANTVEAQRAALLTTRNVDKGLYGASLEHRVGMLLAAAANDPFAVLVTNMARFVDQARALREHLPGASFDFIAGYDTLVRVFDERYYEGMEADLEEFFAHHRLIATNRGEPGLGTPVAFLESEPVRPFRERVLLTELDERSAALSSTQARSGDLSTVPAPVAAYIERNGLYGRGTTTE